MYTRSKSATVRQGLSNYTSRQAPVDKMLKTSLSGRLAASGSGRTGQSGQAIVEGVVALWLIITAGTAVILLLLNFAAGLSYKSKLDTIAGAVARHAAQNRYWLGMEKPANEQLSAAELEAQGTTLANLMLRRMGLPPTSSVRINLQNGSAAGVGGTASIVSATFNVAGLPLPGGSYMPSVIQLSGSAVECETAVSPYATFNINLLDPNNPGTSHIASLPAYWFGNAPTNFAAGAPDVPVTPNPSGLASGGGDVGSGKVVNCGVSLLIAPGSSQPIGVWQNGTCNVSWWPYR